MERGEGPDGGGTCKSCCLNCILKPGKSLKWKSKLIRFAPLEIIAVAK